MSENRERVLIIAEAGINLNGSLENAKKMIDLVSFAGADAIKFQKRDINLVYSQEELNKERITPFGKTNRDLKEKLEFSMEDYEVIDKYCKSKGLEWFVSCWDLESLKKMDRFDLKYQKLASPMLTVLPLVEEIAKRKKYCFISTGMAEMYEINKVVEIFRKNNCEFELMHCNSSYPMENSDANLKMIDVLRKKFKCFVGYSSHERGLQISLAATSLGISSLERHVSLDPENMFGSDQSSSVRPTGFLKLVRDVRIIESAMGNGIKVITPKEQEIRNKLSQPFWYKQMLENEKID